MNAVTALGPDDIFVAVTSKTNTEVSFIILCGIKHCGVYFLLYQMQN